MRATATFGALLALLACGDPLAPVSVGAVYHLRSINGDPLPWSPPTNDSAYVPQRITEGWVTFVDASNAQRHERSEGWVTNANGDRLPLVNDWTSSATYERIPGKIVLSYPPSPGGGAGADTLYLGARGTLLLRQAGYLSPLDSTVRHFCITAC
ncbi:MAG TPA: hypothetical protein VGU74_10225 [Gemmatimonadales bacterium]|nr:hypothetical protein [Gemmatimonadales bacterium]